MSSRRGSLRTAGSGAERLTAPGAARFLADFPDPAGGLLGALGAAFFVGLAAGPAPGRAAAFFVGPAGGFVGVLGAAFFVGLAAGLAPGRAAAFFVGPAAGFVGVLGAAFFADPAAAFLGTAFFRRPGPAFFPAPWGAGAAPDPEEREAAGAGLRGPGDFFGGEAAAFRAAAPDAPAFFPGGRFRLFAGSRGLDAPAFFFFSFITRLPPSVGFLDFIFLWR